MQLIGNIVARHKQGERIGVTSVCSAHPLVIEATFAHALRHDTPVVLIEATSNQVNQDGGYTGMVPADFRRFVEAVADRTGFPLERLALGGDHLGPNAWTSLPADAAMAKAEIMIADYVRAGFSKIHLDCSMSCADDPSPLPERQIAERAARLCRVAEDAYTGDAADAPVYVIGTEVPVPGGAAEDLETLALTTPEAALATLDMHRDLFAERGLEAAWRRVIATVVQPGVEFDHMKVVDYRPEAAAGVRGALDRLPVRRRARRTGTRPFRDPEGRPRRNLRVAGGLVGARRNRTRDGGRVRSCQPARRHARAHEGRTSQLA